jgi:hypothetical protein
MKGTRCGENIFFCTFRIMTSYSDVLCLNNGDFVLGDVCKGRCLFRKESITVAHGLQENVVRAVICVAGYLDNRQVLQAKINKGMYRKNKTRLAARVWSAVAVVSVESEGFRSFLK